MTADSQRGAEDQADSQEKDGRAAVGEEQPTVASLAGKYSGEAQWDELMEAIKEYREELDAQVDVAA